MGTLYIVPTPIGNLEDITVRALRVLREVALIAAEDTRTSRVLLQHYDIRTPLTSYHEHNKLTKIDAVFDALANADVALISDAGMPGISDPGYELIREAVARGVRVEPLPGPSALITALVGSGLPTDGFVYLGFLPRKRPARRALLAGLVNERRTLLAFESPNRLLESLADFEAVLGDRPACVAREMTKIHEEFFRGRLSSAAAHFTTAAPRGEIVLVVRGAPATEDVWDADRVRAALIERIQEGESLGSAAKAVAAQAGWSRRDVYNLGLELQSKS